MNSDTCKKSYITDSFVNQVCFDFFSFQPSSKIQFKNQINTYNFRGSNSKNNNPMNILMPKKQRKYKSFFKLLGLTAAAGLSAFYYGYCITYFNSISFKDIVGIYSLHFFNQSLTEGLITASINFAGAFGSLIAVPLGIKVTNRICLLVSAYMAVILGFVILIPNIWILVGVRLLQGLAIGITSAQGVCYISDMIPKSVVAPFWSFYQFLYVFGIAFSYILSAICSKRFEPQLYWRIVFGFPIITGTIQIIALSFIFYYEPAKYYVQNGQQEEALKCLRAFYKQKYVEAIFKQTVQTIEYYQGEQQNSEVQQTQINLNNNQNDLSKPLMTPLKGDSQQFIGTDLGHKTFGESLKPIQLRELSGKKSSQKKSTIKQKKTLTQMLNDANKKQEQIKQQKKKLMLQQQNKMTMSKSKNMTASKQGSHQRLYNNRTAAFICVYMAAQQAFMGSIMVINYPKDLVTGIFPQMKDTFPMLVNLAGMLAPLFSICILNKVGRRKIILFGTFFSAASLCALCVLYFYIDYEKPGQAPYQIRATMVVLLFVLRTTIALTFTSVCDIYFTEIVQGALTTWCTVIQWFSTTIVMTIIPTLIRLAQGNPKYVFAVFGGVTTLSYFVNYRYVLQTKSKSQIEVRKMYDQKFPDRFFKNK